MRDIHSNIESITAAISNASQMTTSIVDKNQILSEGTKVVFESNYNIDSIVLQNDALSNKMMEASETHSHMTEELQKDITQFKV